jgi:hypothetical protein
MRPVAALVAIDPCRWFASDDQRCLEAARESPFHWRMLLPSAATRPGMTACVIISDAITT